ncbi:MAG: hemerythrin domain-containing protein [Myxococcales bacterium]|nr:hemerythrin domain-containing protein [Myxococcales bacterium]
MTDSADRIIDDHRFIRQQLQKLESATRSDEAAELLAELSPIMSEHFKAEEEPDTGLYAIVGEAGPQHNRAIDALFAEHRDLESAVAELQTLLGERADHPLGPLGNKVKDFVSQLRQHEANETELLSVAANDDMGAAD